MSAKIYEDSIILGNGTSSPSKYWYANTGSANLPGMRYETGAVNAMQFSNDGVSWRYMLGNASLFTSGSVIFAGSGNVLSEDNSRFFWDNTLKYLGVNTATPSERLHVVGNMRIDGLMKQYSGVNEIVSINGQAISSATRVVAFNNATGVTSATNVFIANNTGTAFGVHGAANHINIGTAYYGSNGSIMMLGRSANASSILIGNGSEAIGSGFGTDKHCIIGNDNTTASTVAGSAGSGAIVYGTDNLYSANRASTSGRKLLIFGVGNNIVQSTQQTAIAHEKIVIGVGITDTQETVTKKSFGFGHGAYACLYDTTQKNELFGGLLLTATGYDQASTNTRYQPNGTAPTTTPADTYAQYSADAAAGNAAPHFRTEAGNVVKLYSETTAIAAAAFVANTSLIADDTATFGGYTIGQVVAALKNLGLLT